MLQHHCLLSAALATLLVALHQLQAQAQPLPDGMCGNWQASYTEMHRKMIAGDIPPRYLIYLGGGSGLADVMSGVGTVMVLALLTKRAIILDTIGAGYAWHWSWGYEPVNVNWSLAHLGGETPRFPHICNNDTVKLQGFRGRKRGMEPINFTAAYGPSQAIRCATLLMNGGQLMNLFNNPFHRDELYSMGLRPDTAFGCTVRYLLRPRPQVLEQHPKLLATMQDPKMFKIGVQIRSGDKWWERGGAPNVSTYANFFECAAALEEFRRPEQSVVWFLVSDSAELRRAAQIAYPNRVLTVVSDKIQHVIRGWRNFNNSGGPQVFQQAVADHWLFTMVDFFVISHGSGFGRTAFFLSLRSHTAYSLLPGQERNCHRGRHDHADYLALLGARI